MWIAATKNKEDFFNARKLAQLIKKEFPNLFISWEGELYNDAHAHITIRDHDKIAINLVLWETCEGISTAFNSQFKTNIVDRLDSIGKEDEADKIINLMEDGYIDFTKCIYFPVDTSSKTVHIFNWMRQYFQAYVIDHRIFPDIILPIPDGESVLPIVKKSRRNIVKKFGEWISK